MKDYKSLTLVDSKNGTSFPSYMAIFDRLEELENKIENGTLIELPCKVGDTAYYVVNHENDYVIEKGFVKGISVEVNDIWIACHYRSGLNYWHKYKDNYDKLFFNYAEAEQKLKELLGESI